MWRNYIKIAMRNLIRHKGYSFINVAGLAVGMACCILIMVYVKDELSYDHAYGKGDRIFRVTREFFNLDGKTNLKLGFVAPQVATLLRTDFPDLKVTQFTRDYESRFEYNRQVFIEDQFFWADEHAFELFDFELLEGNGPTMLKEPNSLVLTESAARKYFGNENALGKTIVYGGDMNMKVSGVLRDLPANTHFHFTILGSFSTLHTLLPKGSLENWGSNNYLTYLLLPPDRSAKALEEQLVGFIDKHFPLHGHGFKTPHDMTLLHLQPLYDIHLYSHLDGEVEPNGDIMYVYIFSIIAVFILLIACVNFMNLSTAKAADRGKEVGIRKVAGAVRADLIRQFLYETLVIAFLASVAAIGLVELTLPKFSAFSGKELSLNLFNDYIILSGVFLIALVTGVLAGSYPAFYLSAFQPVAVLKNTMRGSRHSRLRSTLVILQFAISIALIAGIGVIQNQITYCRTASLGFDKEHVVFLPAPQDVRLEDIRTQLLENSGVISVSGASRVPSGRLLDASTTGIEWKGEMKQIDFRIATVRADEHYIPTYGIELAAGRNFSKEFSTDDTAAVIFSETAVQAIGWQSNEDAIGKRVETATRHARVIGVVKDFHFESMREKISPIIFWMDPRAYGRISVRVRPENIAGTIDFLKKKWNGYRPDIPFTYQFIDENFDKLYRSEEKLSTLLEYFSALAVFIACLGLLGLAAFMAERRTKEIGIRKVLGASITGIIVLFSKEFGILVIAANIVAWPLTYWLMHRWLNNFAYRIDMDVWTFVLSGAAALAISLATVSYQAIKAATANPADALKYE